MSDINILDNETSHELSLTSQSVEYIRIMAKWGKFLSIVGFVFIGLTVISALSIGAMFSNLPGEVPGFDISGVGRIITVVYLLTAAFFLYPTLKLYQFSSRAKSALSSRSTQQLTESLGNLKSIFSFMGIFIAIILGLYAVLLVIALIRGLVGFVG